MITYTVVIAENDGRVYLLDIYDKADYSTVDTTAIRQMIKRLQLPE